MLRRDSRAVAPRRRSRHSESCRVAARVEAGRADARHVVEEARSDSVRIAEQLRAQLGPDTLVENLETGAAFWHMVDLLWIVLFPLVYVLR